MPTYSYACTECGHRFDAVQSFSDASLSECPACTGRLRKVFSSVGVVFKGSGFYRNDSRKTSDGRSDGASDGSTSDKPEKKSDKVTASGGEKAASDAKPSSGSPSSGSPSSGSPSSGSPSSGSKDRGSAPANPAKAAPAA